MGKKQKQTKVTQQVPQHFEVFLTGLPYETTQQDIKNFFDFASAPVVKLPKYQDTGRCLGYGHVQLANEEQYNKALQKDHQNIGNRYVVIRPAKGKKQVEVEEKSTVPVGCKVLFVKNLPYQLSKSDLSNQFSSCGVIKDVRMIKNWQTKKFKGFAYIDFKDNGSVKKAIAKYHGKMFRQRKLICDAVTTQMKKGFKRFQQPDGQEAEGQQQNNEQIQDEQSDGDDDE